MLTQLVDLLENKKCGLSIAEISRFLSAQPSAVLPMVELLVRKGKLVQIVPGEAFCSDCGIQSQCNLLAMRGIRYAPAHFENIEAGVEGIV